MDPRTPVIVGVGQAQRPPDSTAPLVDPFDLMVDALRTAAEDGGDDSSSSRTAGAQLLKQTQSVRVVGGLSWQIADPGAVLAARLGMHPQESLVTATGGNSPQMLVNDTAAAIARGELDVAVIVGAEAVYSRRQARKVGERAPVTEQPAGTAPARLVGLDKIGSHNAELARGLTMPIHVYPVMENAVWAASGVSVDEHRRVIAELWSGFSEVASRNPHAWSREARTPAEVGTAGPDNRMVSFPYPKLMNANIQVDQGAALLLCSLEAARAAGVADDRLVFPHSGSDAADHWFVSERENLHSSPAIRLAGRMALELAGVGIDDIAHVDLYSCFPVAVEIAAAELGLSLDRQLTQTGGLVFGGGPGNNYVTHSIAALVETLRRDPGTLGLVNANGWYVTKHAVGIYGTEPPKQGFRVGSPQAEVDALPRRAVVEEHDGPVAIESFTVTHDRDGAPELGIVACLLPEGGRAWANTRDDALLAALMAGDRFGAPAHLHQDGTLTT